ncbi:MAG: RAP domain-containing protein [Planctomycetota bacterium]
MANTVWAFATVGVAAELLFEAIAAEARRRISEFNPQNMANAVWAYATAGVPAESLFEAIAVEARNRIDEFDAQAMANTVWAFAKSGVVARWLFETVAAEARKRLEEFSAQDLANTVWAFATAGVAAQSLFEAIAAEARNRVTEFNAQDMANTVWAFATAGVAAQQLFDAIAAEARKRVTKFNAQELANTIWAFACVGWTESEVFRWLESALTEGQNDMTDIEKSQLYQAALHIKTEWPELEFPLPADLDSLVSAYTKHEPEPSQLQREVSAMLEQMGWSHTFEYVTVEGFSLDLAQPDSKQAIEVDGPYHFLKDATSGEYVVNGATQFKSRLLRARGWRISHVAFFEFDDKSESERRELLFGKLAEIGLQTKALSF